MVGVFDGAVVGGRLADGARKNGVGLGFDAAV